MDIQHLIKIDNRINTPTDFLWQFVVFLPKSIEVVTKYDVFGEKHKQRYYMVSKCQSVKVSKCQTDRGSVILGSNK